MTDQKEEKKGPVEVKPESRISEVVEEPKPQPTFIAIHWDRVNDQVAVSASGFANDIEREGFVHRFCDKDKYEAMLANQRRAQAAAQDNGKDPT